MKYNIKSGKRYRKGLEFNVFTRDEFDGIHAAALEVFWKKGVFIEGEEALQISPSGERSSIRKQKP